MSTHPKNGLPSCIPPTTIVFHKGSKFDLLLNLPPLNDTLQVLEIGQVTRVPQHRGLVDP